jgi:hypothetical protein
VYEYYHNRQNLVLVGPSVVPWGCPYGIGIIPLNFRN